MQKLIVNLIESLEVKKINNTISAKSKNFIQQAVKMLEQRGVVLIRNLYDEKLLADIQKTWNINFKRPSVSGTVGYYRTSYAKAVLPLFLLGRPAMKVALEKKIIFIIEKYMKSKCTLAEANAVWHKATNYIYFPLHSDFAAGWKKSKSSAFSLEKKDMKDPVGVGAMLYLHNTASGAFKYAIGSHKLQSNYGQHLKNYPKEKIYEINDNIEVCIGKKGDLILFDDRGFHGPDQPSKKDRKVLLFDYYRNKTFGSVVVTSHTINITDISILDKTQLRVLGLHASEMVNREEYVSTRFKKNLFYKLIVWMTENAYFYIHLKSLIKKKLNIFTK